MARPISGSEKKRPVNITLEPDVLKIARAHVKSHKISLSEFVADLIQERVGEVPDAAEVKKPAASLHYFPLLESIAAGVPTESVRQADSEPEVVLVPAALAKKIRKGERGFVLRVKGESMIGQGIEDGDLVLMAEREPKVGDIVAAQVDGDRWTLKTLALRDGKPVLLCANKKFKDICPVERMDIRHVFVCKLEA
jgi:repressor LexA